MSLYLTSGIVLNKWAYYLNRLILFIASYPSKLLCQNGLCDPLSLALIRGFGSVSKVNFAASLDALSRFMVGIHFCGDICMDRNSELKICILVRLWVKLTRARDWFGSLFLWTCKWKGEIYYGQCYIVVVVAASLSPVNQVRYSYFYIKVEMEGCTFAS